MNEQKSKTTIKDVLLNNLTWIIGILAFGFGLYINTVVSPLDHRIDILAKDVEENRNDVARCTELHDTVIINSDKLDTILLRLDKIDKSLHR